MPSGDASRSIARALAVALAVAASPARANPLEVLGLTSRHAGQADAAVASVDDAASVYYNPAGLAAAPRLELAFGGLGTYAHLRAGAARAKLHDPYGFQFAIRAPLPLRGALHGRLVAGLALHVLPRDLIDIVAPAPDQPFYPYFDRMARVVAIPGIAARITDDLQIGVAANVLAGLDGRLTADEGVTRALDARIDEQVHTVARLIAGAQYQLGARWRIGAAYRQQFELGFHTAVQTVVGGEPIVLDLGAHGLYSPHEVLAGVAYQHPRATISVDAQWSHWSAYPGPYVQVASVLPFAGAIPGQAPRVAFSDTGAARIGIETTRSRCSCGGIARAGYAFESSAVPAAQPGVSNLLDGPHHTFALGGGWQWPRALAGRGLRVDAHVALTLVQPRTITKVLYGGTSTYDPNTSLRDEDPDTAGLQISNPGYPSLRSGGQLFGGGVTVEVGL